MATHAANITPITSAAPAPAARPAAVQERYLFGPVVDFLCLGGATLLLLPVFLAVGDNENFAGMAAIMMIAAHFINHPHFAASYQIFYRGFREKAFTPALGRAMQVRYLVAGVVVPVVMGLIFIYGTVTANAQLLGYCGNLMALTVGWHYAKQGYGMLMVDAVLKRRFFSDAVKKVLLVNCYVAWAASWLRFNQVVSQQDLWGLSYYTFAVPEPIVHAALVGAALTGVASVVALLEQWHRTGSLPVNGVIAYVVSIYAWLMFVTINPIWGLVVPALHSLQYLVVVGRFELNYERGRPEVGPESDKSTLRSLFGANAGRRFIVFFVLSGVIGWLGFWGLPGILDGLVPYDNLALTSTLFLFFSWSFINVHHYFMDNVMWRRENPDTAKYLFS